MDYLGNYYAGGLGVKRDIDRGIEYHKQAYRRHSPIAAHNLATTYHRLYQLDNARKWYQRAAEAGNGDALVDWAQLELNDDRPRLARKLAARALKMASTASISQLAREKAAWMMYGLHAIGKDGLPPAWKDRRRAPWLPT